MTGLTMIDVYQIPKEEVEKIEWRGDYKEYDYNLFKLGKGHKEFIIVNPAFENYKIKSIPYDGNRCIVWKYKNQWVAKYFNTLWDIEKRYAEVEADIEFEVEWTRNPEIDTKIVFENDPTVTSINDLYDLNYEMIWYVDPKLTDSNIWAFKGKLKNYKIVGTKDMGYVSIPKSDQLDVIFISYNEPNAEKNWLRVLEKSPKAFRINSITGIVNAHKCAAELATTDMFYVVDGDAYLTDDWSFEYQPSIFDRDCVHVWRSRNPINGLEYGYGGVKLLPRELTLKVDENCVDMTTSISTRFKPMNKVSNITEFNTDEFNTWRSAFRECAKLSSNILKRQLSRESEKRLNIWCTVDSGEPFGEWAIKGAKAGQDFGQANKHDTTNLALINDLNWMKLEFLKSYY
jgi:hypothetical protein